MKKRIVVKIGSSSLTDVHGRLSLTKLNHHAKALAALKRQGHEVILISSGAVSAGFNDLGYPTRPTTVSGKQAAAAVGQGLLIRAYTEAFKRDDIACAQLLLTRDVFTHQEQYSNAYTTLSELLKRGVLPIINENDSIAVEELTFGDNDMLSALVSGLIHADLLIILTDINGLYSDNPKTNPHAERYRFLPAITSELMAQGKEASSSKVGTGGMKSKLHASQTALSLGVNVFIGTGDKHDNLINILNGAGDGTYIGDTQNYILNKPKQWIAFHSPIHGTIQIDHGAERALIEGGKSLLPAGIIACKGLFNINDVVEIINMKHEAIGKGQVNYSAEDLNKIKGLASHQAILKTDQTRPEVIHRNRLVLSFTRGNSK
ncbi:glutamate 5-kinase [Pullulanibacillus pueri]|uniref:Glutamate 5-kinase n=1 Tax=Pullulanibacillus pueri TaxID=1437324 RepID=A0A8J2ZTR7_9BACL|nr:glutamate 5-kinase [Pullulanibacillus pueri]MBM7681051.1 glutamate 5-kinase [Pullulanibacillus pueri]GGH76849.1 glutamate 5-kinase [Pullulanibacillus pueri]